MDVPLVVIPDACAGPRILPAAISASACFASASADSGKTRMNAWQRLSSRSMRSSSARVSSTGERSLLRKRRPASAIPSQASSMRDEGMHGFYGVRTRNYLNRRLSWV